MSKNSVKRLTVGFAGGSYFVRVEPAKRKHKSGMTKAGAEDLARAMARRHVDRNPGNEVLIYFLDYGGRVKDRETVK